jgi:hypothetical protein
MFSVSSAIIYSLIYSYLSESPVKKLSHNIPESRRSFRLAGVSLVSANSDSAQLLLAEPPGAGGPHYWSSPRILVGVPSQGALLKFYLNLKGECMQSTKQSPHAWQGYITTRRPPGIPEGAVCDRLTHCHSSHGHGTHTVGLGIVFQGLLL